jgi:predicted Zn-dependent protease
VLGHELEHIDHYHCAERIQIQAALQKIPLGQLAALPVEVFVAGYSKNQELEADREGAKLAVAALYSPQGAIRLFQAMERFRPANTAHGSTPVEEMSQVALETLEGYFRSHPPNAERIDQIQKMIAGGQLPDWRNTRPMAFAYFFLTERAWRLLAAANVRPTALLNYKEKQKREEERTRQFREAMQLASQSLILHPNGPRGLEIMAVANLGLAEYDAAMTSYRGIATNAPTFADGVRIYADLMAREALRAELYQQAKQLALISLEMQPNRPEALEILAEAQLRLSDLRGAAESGGKLREVDSTAATAVSVYASRLASASLSKINIRKRRHWRSYLWSWMPMSGIPSRSWPKRDLRWRTLPRPPRRTGSSSIETRPTSEWCGATRTRCQPPVQFRRNSASCKPGCSSISPTQRNSASNRPD